METVNSALWMDGVSLSIGLLLFRSLQDLSPIDSWKKIFTILELEMEWNVTFHLLTQFAC